MDQTIPTDDLDSLVTEDFSSTSDSSESEQDVLQSAIEAMSGGLGSSLKSPPNQRNFASLLGNAQKSPERNFTSLLGKPQKSPERNFASLLGQPQKSPERNFASLLEPKGSNQRSFATILGRQKSPNRNFSSLLPSRDSNSKFTLVLKSKGGQDFPTKKITLIPKTEVLVGRKTNGSGMSMREDNSCLFDCRVLSRKHASFWLDNDQLFIKDLKSSNGTFVNTQRLSPLDRKLVDNGDIIQFGQDVSDPGSSEFHQSIVAEIELIRGAQEKVEEISPELEEIKDHFVKLEKSQDSVEDKMNRLKSTLKQVKLEVKESWVSMVTEDLVLSKIEFLEDKVLKLKPAESNLQQMLNRLDSLDEKVTVLWRAQKSTFSILISFSMLFSFLLVVFLGYLEIVAIKENKLCVW